MTWIIPVTDRVLADVTNQTSKGFFNVIDWVRINGNTEHVATMVSVLRGVAVSLNDLTTPTMATIPTAADINEFVENIENLRTASGLGVSSNLVDLKTDYFSGSSSETPDYEDVNDWERNLATIKILILSASVYEVFCGVAAVGQPRFWQNRFRDPFIKDSTSPVRRARAGIAICGTGMKRQNKFRRYD